MLGDALWERFNRDADTPWYYRRLAEIFTERLPHSPLTAELMEAVTDLEAEIAANRAALVVLHADWGKNPKKRWIARARRSGDDWVIEAVGQWGEEGSPLTRLGLPSDEPGPILIGVDFPIGLPKAYAEKAGVTSFRDVLPLLGGEGWEGFYDVAHSAAEISMRRPFYPYAHGGKSQEHLTERLGISITQLRRRCEEATAARSAACPLFWTLGANQVGKGAIAGWQELVAPLVRDADAALWPFDGGIAELVASRRLTLCETYPAEYYKPLGFGPSGWSKRTQADRAARAPQIMEGAAGVPATAAPTFGR